MIPLETRRLNETFFYFLESFIGSKFGSDWLTHYKHESLLTRPCRASGIIGHSLSDPPNAYKPAPEVPLGRRVPIPSTGRGGKVPTPRRSEGRGGKIYTTLRSREAGGRVAYNPRRPTRGGDGGAARLSLLTLPHWGKRAWVAMACVKDAPPPTMAGDQLRSVTGTHPALPPSLPPGRPSAARLTCMPASLPLLSQHRLPACPPSTPMHLHYLAHETEQTPLNWH